MPLRRLATRSTWRRLATMACLVAGRSAAAERILDAMVAEGEGDDAWVLASRAHLRAS